MLTPGLILLVGALYLSALFAIASWGDRQAAAGRSPIGPAVYALSIAVYSTSWTFYGSVGLAARTGFGFLPIYLGPTLAFMLGWVVLRKIIRIAKTQRLTSIADFIAARYGKRHLLGGLVSVIAVIGIMPYISLQLKAVSSSFATLSATPEVAGTTPDAALVTAILLAIFAVLFGARHIDAAERHEGLVVAIAFESAIKLMAFLAVGLYVVFGLYDGFGDVFGRALERAELASLMSVATGTGYRQWVSLTLLSMLAILVLPRQFHVTVVENKSERHLASAMWMFPGYLVAINLFVLPIALAGRLQFDGAVDADTYVLALPLAGGADGLALLVFIGGLSAASAMVIVAAIALATMICNDLVMPALIRFQGAKLTEREDVSRLLLGIRRVAMVTVIGLGYLYYRLIGDSYALVSIGLLSFTAAAQFAPPMLIGLYWKGGSFRGALWGLCAGFLIWSYTLLLPSFARSGWLPESFITDGPLAIAWLKPYALFGLSGWDNISHALFWSLLANIGFYLAGSLTGRRSATERLQAALFVDAFEARSPVPGGRGIPFAGGGPTVGALEDLAARFLGRGRAEAAFKRQAERDGARYVRSARAEAEQVRFTERLLAGAVGSASARVMLGSMITPATPEVAEVMRLLDETSHVLEHSRVLEAKSDQLETALEELRGANRRLRDLDKLKDEFLSTVSHEMRTPLTSIRSFVEILFDNPDLPVEQRQEFLRIVAKESERLTRLIEDVLALGRLESGRMVWHLETLAIAPLIDEATDSLGRLFNEAGIRLSVDCAEDLPPIRGDHDKLIQVLVNLLSNAVKFAPDKDGRVLVRAELIERRLRISVIDNGPGVPVDARGFVFDRFRQAGDTLTGKPRGSGLGLAISKAIVEHLGGTIWVDDAPRGGACFSFTLPLAPAQPVADPQPHPRQVAEG